jgi:hypothetical protein
MPPAVAIGAAVLGAGASVYGANKQSKAIKSANAANQQAVQNTNDANYRLWLESRGVGPSGQAVNTKLPRWMGATVGTGGGGRQIVRKGAAGAAPARMISAASMTPQQQTY